MTQTKENRMNYTIRMEGGYFYIYSDGRPLLTPGKHKIYTLYKRLAVRMIDDLKLYGYLSYKNCKSILAYHFLTEDSFAQMGKENVRKLLANDFLRKPDWTCVKTYGSGWRERFGRWESREEQITRWLDHCTEMQLAAVFRIGNAFHSINVAYVLVRIMEHKPVGSLVREEAICNLAKKITGTYKFGSYEDILQEFEAFEFYYQFHLDENGPTLAALPDEANEDCLP